MIIENKEYLDGLFAHPGYFLVVYYKYECIHIGKRLKCVTWIYIVLNYIELKQNRRLKMKELIKFKDSDYKNYRELKLKFLDSRIPSQAYAINNLKLKPNQKNRIYHHWTRYSIILDAISKNTDFLAKEEAFKTMDIGEMDNILFNRVAISLRRSLHNPFILMLRPNIKKEYAEWIDSVLNEYKLTNSIRNIPVRGRRKGLYKLYIYPDYSKFSRAYDVDKSIEVLYKVAEAVREGKVESAVDMRTIICDLCKEMGYVPSFQTGTIVKLYKSMAEYYSLYLKYKEIGDDLYDGESFAKMNKKYNFTAYGIYNIKDLYARITIHVSIIALYIRTKDTIISRLFNINYKGYMK